jgi:hypothetical protein
MEQMLAIQAVKQGKYPQEWQVYYGQGEHSATVSWIIAAIITLWWWRTTSTGSDTFFMLFLSLVPCILCLLGAAYFYRKSRLKKKTFIIIQPDYVLQCYAGNINTVSSLIFSQIETMSSAHEAVMSRVDKDISTSRNYWLEVQYIDGNHHKWPISDALDQPFITRRVIAAFDQYQSQTTNEVEDQYQSPIINETEDQYQFPIASETEDQYQFPIASETEDQYQFPITSETEPENHE